MKKERLTSIDARDIIRLRERLRLSQAQFAQRLNVARRTVSRWETGESEPSKVFIMLMEEMQ